MQKKKSGVKKCLEICAIKGGGVGPLMANAILNFHFDFLTTSLSLTLTVGLLQVTIWGEYIYTVAEWTSDDVLRQKSSSAMIYCTLCTSQW